MNGFESDIVSILKQNMLYHKESIGYIKGGASSKEKGLADLLEREKLLVVREQTKVVFTYDYVFLPYASKIKDLVEALGELSPGGIIIYEIDPDNDNFDARYVSLFGMFSITKVGFDDRRYMIIHSGVDYGN